VLHAHQKALHSGAQLSFVCDVRAQHADGRWIWVEVRAYNMAHDPDIHGILTALRDVTTERNERTANALALEHADAHDALTNLPSRRKLTSDLSELLDKRGSAMVTVYFCDVDSFKHVNDGLGHGIGDETLQALAARVIGILPPQATLYRFGGDEFVIVHTTTQPKNRERAQEFENALLRAASMPLTRGPHELVVTLSVGVTTLAGHTSVDELLREADIALYASKRDGKNCVRHFDASMQIRADRRYTLEQALRKALLGNEFRMVFQPKVDAHTREVLGFEALLRWTSTDLGVVHPAEFIPVAEETGLITELGRRAIHDSCAFVAALRSAGLVHLSVAVNVSAKQMLDSDTLLSEVAEALAFHNIPGKLLELELTESIFVQGAETAILTLTRLKALGVKLSVDDFGTGYSSLAYLRRFPLDSLKIDRAFVCELLESSKDYAIVAAIIAMARTLTLTTVAEGVEREDELVALQTLGCDEIQGYFIARPLERSDALRFALSALTNPRGGNSGDSARMRASTGVIVSVPPPVLRQRTPVGSISPSEFPEPKPQ
jgi:diguanylate cyclase (GGDEF)-like protein